MKRMLVVFLLVNLMLSGCAPASAPMPTPVPSATPLPTATAYTPIPPTATLTLTPYPSPTYTAVPLTATPRPTDTPTPNATPGLGLCPIDMTLPGVYIFQGYVPGQHHGLDIAGPIGIPHRSPGNCRIDELFIGYDGANGILLICSDIPVSKIGLGHLDFTLNDYDTLRWYGVPLYTFYNEDGSPKYGVLGVVPLQHRSVRRGEDLHVYMGNTGHSGLPHTHIGVWTIINGQLTDLNDPLLYLDCNLH